APALDAGPSPRAPMTSAALDPAPNAHFNQRRRLRLTWTSPRVWLEFVSGVGGGEPPDPSQIRHPSACDLRHVTISVRTHWAQTTAVRRKSARREPGGWAR